jgi:CheY-like chemotaxis protein
MDGKCILIVDDNAVIRRSLRRILESVDGWQVCGEAADGQEGIEKAKELDPDLIILDLSMPRLNGLEAARILSKAMPKIPLLMFFGPYRSSGPERSFRSRRECRSIQDRRRGNSGQAGSHTAWDRLNLGERFPVGILQNVSFQIPQAAGDVDEGLSFLLPVRALR